VNGRSRPNLAEIHKKTKILCLMTVARAGSKLFHSLLDNHPQVLCFPRTLKFGSFWRDASSLKHQPELLIDKFIERHAHFFSARHWYSINNYDRADQLGADRQEGVQGDTSAFRNIALSLFEGKSPDRRTLFLALHFAYQEVCGRAIPDDPLILYHIHDVGLEDELRACLEDFPESQVLMMVRNPIDSLDAEIKWMRMHCKVSARVLFKYYCAVANDAGNLLNNFPAADIRVLPFEQLHARSREAMERLCSWTGLKWDDSLLVSTMHGKLWWGNGKAPRQGFNPGLKMYDPSASGVLIRNDFDVLCALGGERMGLYGYCEGVPCKEIHRRIGWPNLLLPTATEWELVKLVHNPAYWLWTLRTVYHDLHDPKMLGIDYYSKRELPKGAPLLACRYLATISRLLWRASIFFIIRFYARRVAFCRRLYSREDLRQRLPKLLLAQTLK